MACTSLSAVASATASAFWCDVCCLHRCGLQATVSTSRMSTTFENDPLLGWAFRMYKDWTTQKQQQLEQQMQQQLEEERRRALQEPKPWRPAPAGQQQHGGSSNAPDKA